MRPRTVNSRFLAVLAITVVFVGSNSSPGRADDSKPMLRAGAFAIDITPTKSPVDSAGSLTRRFAEAAHDPLHARCLVLDNGEETIAIAVCDHCVIPREIFDSAKR